MRTVIDKYKIVRSLIHICEYMYRKGIRDAADVFDSAVIDEFLQEDRLALILENDSRIMSEKFFAAKMSVICYSIKEPGAAKIFDYSCAKPQLVLGACELVNRFYRNGLRDGIGIDLDEAESIMVDFKMHKKYFRIDRGNVSRSYVVSEMLTESLCIENDGKKCGYRIWKFINDGMIEVGMKKSFIYDGEG